MSFRPSEARAGIQLFNLPVRCSQADFQQNDNCHTAKKHHFSHKKSPMLRGLVLMLSDF